MFAGRRLTWIVPARRPALYACLTTVALLAAGCSSGGTKQSRPTAASVTTFPAREPDTGVVTTEPGDGTPE